jgi:hypothetical protein
VCGGSDHTDEKADPVRSRIPTHLSVVCQKAQQDNIGRHDDRAEQAAERDGSRTAKGHRALSEEP